MNAQEPKYEQGYWLVELIIKKIFGFIQTILYMIFWGTIILILVWLLLLQAFPPHAEVWWKFWTKFLVR